MKRTPLRRKTALRPKVGFGLTGSKRQRRRRSSRPKITPARAAANGQNCTLRLPGCTNASVVLCHLRMFGGGGTGLKPHDSEAVFGCYHCHNLLDRRIDADAPTDFEAIAWAFIWTLRRQREAGVLIYKGEAA